MKKNFIKLLCDPVTKEELKLEVIKENDLEILEGFLVSTNSKYKITNGIPRFVEDEGYSKNFGWQWKKWSTLQFENMNKNKPMEGHTENMFKTITELNEGLLSGKTVLDMGSGSGRFSDIALRLGAEVISLDYSSAIDEAKKNLNNTNINFIQGDVLNLPLKEKTIDFVFSIGVLHHTPSPKKGVEEAFKVLKKGGEFSISVYSKDSLYNFPVIHFWRFIFKNSWKLFKHYPPLFYSIFFGAINYFISKLHRYLTYPIRLIFPTIVLKDLNWSILDTFDSVTTSFQSGHTIPEVQKWFDDIGFSSHRKGNWGVNIIGKK